MTQHHLENNLFLSLQPRHPLNKKKTGDETHLLWCFMNELNPGSLYDLIAKCVSI